jgi:hypothetical protein
MSEKQENVNLRRIIGALLLKVVPDAAMQGVDLTLLSGELEAAVGWNLNIYVCQGLGVPPPLHICMSRPQKTVNGAVVHDEAAEPGGDGKPPRALPPGGELGGG